MKGFIHFIVSSALLFGAMGVTIAQETTVSEDTERTVKEEVVNPRRYEAGGFKDNWFIGSPGTRNRSSVRTHTGMTAQSVVRRL
mgnify:CR=1 FL=1